MNNTRLRQEFGALLETNKKNIIRCWSGQIFKVPGYRRFKDIMPKKTHSKWMVRYMEAFIYDIRHAKAVSCNTIFQKSLFRDYHSANKAEDLIHGQIVLRTILSYTLLRKYKGNFKKLKDMMSILIAEIDKKILFFSKFYKKKDFSRIETIVKYGKRLIAVHETERLCRLILEAAAKESDADMGSITLLDKDGYMRIKASFGIPRKIITTYNQEMGDSISGKVIKTLKPIIINKGQGMTREIGKDLRGMGACSAICVPIIADGRAVGVINLVKYSKKQPFDEEDLELLVILAHEGGEAISNSWLFDEVHELYIGNIISLAAAVDARDHYTHGHSSKVAELAIATARNLDMSHEELKNIYFASMLHDIGKIGIPDKILLKPGSLTKKEFDVVKKHPIYGVKILKHIPRMKKIIPIIYHEHEHYNGKGYCKGISGEKIPIESRVIAVADAYEAMTSNRPYRKAMPKAQAIKELKRCMGVQFDPRVVNAFLKTV